MLVEKIDDIGSEALERSLGYFLDVRGTAVEAGLFAGAGINFEAELGGDYHPAAQGSERLAHQFLVSVGAIDLRGVEECDAQFDGLADQRDHILLVRGRTEAKAHAHAAEAEGGDFQVAVSQFALLHFFSSRAAERPGRRSEL